MQLQCSQKQTQMLSPQMLQSMQLLQMGTQELWNYLENTALENPVLDLEPEHPPTQADSQFQRKLEWMASMDR